MAEQLYHHGKLKGQGAANPLRRRMEEQEERSLVTKAAVAARKAMAERGEIPEYNVRSARASDLPLITDAWLTSYRFSYSVGPVPKDIYGVEQRARVGRLVPRSKVLCAVDLHDEARIKGWICFEPPKQPEHYTVVHYICVHPSLQNMGMGSALIAVARSTNQDHEAPMWTTHHTLPMRRLIGRWNLIYNPYILEVMK